MAEAPVNLLLLRRLHSSRIFLHSWQSSTRTLCHSATEDRGLIDDTSRLGSNPQLNSAPELSRMRGSLYIDFYSSCASPPLSVYGLPARPLLGCGMKVASHR